MKRKVSLCLLGLALALAIWSFAQDDAKKTTQTLGVGAIMQQVIAAHKAEAETRQKVAKARSDMRSLEAAINAYMVDDSNMPVGKDDAVIRQRVSRAKADIRGIATAVEAYYVDNNVYPAWSVGSTSVNTLPHPSFRIPDDKQPFMTLTGPVAYMVGYPADPFAESKKTYSFYSDEKGWMIWSPGPDGKYDIMGEDVARLYQYQPNTKTLRPEITNYTYDPTNGVSSGGDIFRFKQ